jgi:hypothetical protein
MKYSWLVDEDIKDGIFAGHPVSFFLAHVAHHGDALTPSDRCYPDTTDPELTFSF